MTGIKALGAHEGTPLRPTTGKQPQGADDLRLLGLGVVTGQTQPVLLTQGHDDVGELDVVHAAAELPVQCIDRRLAQGIAVNVVDGLVQRIPVKQLALDVFGVLLEAGIGAEAGAGGPPKLAADPLLR